MAPLLYISWQVGKRKWLVCRLGWQGLTGLSVAQDI